MCGARPVGCRLARSTLAGARSSSGVDEFGEQRQAAVRVQQPPPPVDDDGRVRLVTGQHLPHRGAYRSHPGRVERSFAERGRVTGRQQQPVAVAQRQVEPFGQLQDHVAARARPAGFDEAEVPGGHLRAYGQFELAEPAPSRHWRSSSPTGCRWVRGGDAGGRVVSAGVLLIMAASPDQRT